MAAGIGADGKAGGAHGLEFGLHLGACAVGYCLVIFIGGCALGCAGPPDERGNASDALRPPTPVESFCSDLQSAKGWVEEPILFVGRFKGFAVDPAVITQGECARAGAVPAFKEGEGGEPTVATCQRTCVGKTACREATLIEVVATVGGEDRLVPGQVVGRCSDALADYPYSEVYEVGSFAIFLGQGLEDGAESACGGLVSELGVSFLMGGYFAWFVGTVTASEGADKMFGYDWRTPSDAAPGGNPFQTGEFNLSFGDLCDIWDEAGFPARTSADDMPAVWPSWLGRCSSAALDVLGPSFSLPSTCDVAEGVVTCASEIDAVDDLWLLWLLKIGSGPARGPNEWLKHDWQQRSLTFGAVNRRR